LRKVIFILIIVIIFTGCSLFKNTAKSISGDTILPYSDNILENVKELNINNKGFFIQKAEIEVLTQSGKETFLGNIKFEKPGRYLISLRNRAGIEGARIYINNDTLLINDRINKKLYFGTTLYLKRKYGLTQSMLPLIFGDIILDNSCDTNHSKCTENRIILNCSISGIMLNYIIDCNKRKTISVSMLDNNKNNGVKISYNNFFSAGNVRLPEKVQLEYPINGIIIKIKILKVDLDWDGSLKFVPGKGYDLIELV